MRKEGGVSWLNVVHTLLLLEMPELCNAPVYFANMEGEVRWLSRVVVFSKLHGL